MISVYTDGACRGNNLREDKRTASIGIFFGDGDQRNVGELLPESLRPFTNNRAEIYACIRALSILREENDIIVYSDSQIVVRTMNGQYKTLKK